MNFFSSTAWIIITFIFFTALVAVVATIKTKGDNLKTADGYFLAGHGLPGIVVAGSLLLTNLSAEQLVGTNGQGWAVGMSPMGWELGAVAPLFVVGLFLMPIFLKMGVTTIPSMMESRFGRSTKLMFSGIIVVMYSVLNLPVILYSGAVVFENIFDISSSLHISKFAAVTLLCIVIGIIGGIYAVCGGLKAVAVSDTINGIGLIIGGLMVPILGLALLGHETMDGGIIDGIRYIMQTEPARLNSWAAWDAPDPAMPWPLLFTGVFFTEIYWWGCNQSFVQRVLGSRSLEDAQKGTIYCGMLKILGFFYLTLPGVIAYFLPSIQEKIAAAGSSAIDFAYPALVTAVIPKSIMGFFAAVLFGAILSSFNSVLNSASTMFSLDLYRSVKPGLPDEKYIKVGKIYGTLAGIVSVVIAPFVMNSSGITSLLNSLSQFICLPVLFTVFGVIFFRRAPRYTPIVITITHVLLYALFMVVKPCWPGTETEIHYLYASAFLFIIELAIMFVLNRIGKEEEFVIPHNGTVDLTPWKYRYIASIGGVLLMVLVYIIFSPIVLAK